MRREQGEKEVISVAAGFSFPYGLGMGLMRLADFHILSRATVTDATCRFHVAAPPSREKTGRVLT